MSRPTGGTTLLVLVSCLVTACGATTASRPPDVSAVPSAASSAPAAPSAATSAPAEPQAIVLDGAWLRPREDASITTSRLTVAARASASGPGAPAVDKVVFRARPKGGDEAIACTARRPGDDGAWACTVDLLALRIPPGSVRLEFDVVAKGASTARSPDGARKVSYEVAPPKPSDARWQDVGARKTGRWEITRTYRVRWTAPAGYASEFLLYDTWQCPRSSARHAGEPCFVAGTPVATSELTLLGRADGDARSMNVEIVESECGPSYGTVLLRARNGYGSSPFAIVEVARVPDPRDTIC